MGKVVTMIKPAKVESPAIRILKEAAIKSYENAKRKYNASFTKLK
jgi:hypothetical protein